MKRKLQNLVLVVRKKIVIMTILLMGTIFICSCDAYFQKETENNNLDQNLTYPSLDQKSYPASNDFQTSNDAYPEPNPNTESEVSLAHTTNNNLNLLEGKLLYQSDHTGRFQIYMQEDESPPIHLTTGLSVAVEGSWSPDGSMIAYATSGNDSTNFIIQIMDADGNNRRNLLEDQPRLNWRPIWSPNGKQIIFLSNRDDNFEIYKVNIDGSNNINLTNNIATDQDPDWSRVNNSIVFVSNRDGTNGIYTMNTDGSNVKQILSGDWNFFYPRWSPDGKLIAFVSDMDTTNDIYIMDAEGNNVSKVTDRIGDNTMPEWVSNDALLFSGDYGDETWDLYKINIDGSELLQLTGPETPSTSSQRYPRWFP